jgi:hypothetical protein
VRLDKLSQIRAPGRNQRWFVISALIHLAVIVGLIVLIRPFRPARTVAYIDLGREGTPMVYQAPSGGGGPERAPGTRAPRATVVAPPDGVTAQPAPSSAQAETANPETDENDSLPIDTHRRLGPEYGDGRLWVKTGDALDGKLPARAAVDSMPTHVARVDSALAAKIRTYLDTVPPDSFATRPAPKWTTQIAGKTWGIDGKWIYLGGVKIPSAVLALLPMPNGGLGNYDESQRQGKIAANRADIMQAAERAANNVEFNRYVKEVRQRKEMEHRAHEEPPPPPLPPPSQTPPLVVSDTTKKQPLTP